MKTKINIAYAFFFYFIFRSSCAKNDTTDMLEYIVNGSYEKKLRPNHGGRPNIGTSVKVFEIRIMQTISLEN